MDGLLGHLNALRVLPGDFTGVAVGHDIECLPAVGVGQQPNRQQRVLERLRRVLRLNPQVALRVAGHFARAQARERVVHLPERLRDGLFEIDLIALDDEAGEKRGVVRHDIVCWKRFHLPEQRVIHAPGRRHGLVVEEMVDRPRRGLPSHVTYLPSVRPALIVAIGFGRVVVVPRVGLPLAVRLRVEGPVGHVQTVQLIDQRLVLERVRREPAAFVPLLHLVANVALRRPERQQALGPDRRLQLLVIHERRRAAELAVPADLLRGEDHDGFAALALHAAAVRVPPAAFLGELPQHRHQVEFRDRAFLLVPVVRRLGAAEGTHEQLLRGIPLGLRAAGGAGVFVARRDCRRCRLFRRAHCLRYASSDARVMR